MANVFVLGLVYMIILLSDKVCGQWYRLQEGVRYSSGVLERDRSRTKEECAVQGSIEPACSGFNIGFGQCELLSSLTYYAQRSVAAGWSFGYEANTG